MVVVVGGRGSLCSALRGKVRSTQAEAAFPSSHVFLLQQMKRPFYFIIFSPTEGKSASGPQ